MPTGKVWKYIWFVCLEEDDESSSRMMLTPRSSSMSLSTSLFLTSHRHCLLDLVIVIKVFFIDITLTASVADRGCLSRISDPENRSQKQHHKRRGNKFFCPTIFCCHSYHKIVDNFIFEQVKKTFLARSRSVVPVKMK
jgi:hypothetical protein